MTDATIDLIAAGPRGVIRPIFDASMNGTSSMSAAWAIELLLDERQGSRVAPVKCLLVNDIEHETTVVRESPAVRTSLNPRVMIENLRTIAGLNIVDIGGLMRVSRQTVHNWINGDTITAENRERLATAYRVVTETVVGMSADDARAYLHTDSEGGKTRLATIASHLDVDQIDPRGPNAYDLLVGDADIPAFSVEKFGRRVDVGPVQPFVSKGPKTV